MRQPSPHAQRGLVLLAVVGAALVAGPFALRLVLLRTRTFDPDELQHLHAAWYAHHGLLPYRDFFEHHMPALHFLLGWGMGAFQIDTIADDAVRFLFVARSLMWLLALAVVTLTMRIGARVGGTAVAWMAGALLSTSVVFIGRSMEIRPDVPALVCWLVALLALAHGIGSVRDARGGWRWFASSGLAIGAGLITNQKILLAGPGIVVALLWYVWQSPGVRTRCWFNILVASVAVLVPLILLAGYYWLLGALPDLVQGALLNNLGWPREVSARTTLRWMLLRDPLMCAIGAAGLVDAAVRIVTRPGSTLPLAALMLPTASLLAGLAITPAPYPQYMLLVLPVGCVVGGQALWLALGGDETRPDRNEHSWLSALTAASGCGVAALGLYVARPVFVYPIVYPAFGIAAASAVWFFAVRKAAAVAAAVLLLACSVYSAQQLRWMQGLTNTDALAQMRFVHASSGPTDAVLDGFTGVAWFRPSASRFPFLHSGIRARLSPQDVNEIVNTMETCRTRPRIVVLDGDLLALSPLVAPHVARDYEPSPFPSIWLRKEPCAP